MRGERGWGGEPGTQGSNNGGGGWSDRGDRASDNEDWPDNGGEGRGSESLGSGGLLKREKWVREGEGGRKLEVK